MSEEEILGRARAEKILAEEWFGGKYSQEEAQVLAKANGLSMDMVDYWYGIAYEKQERASHGFN